MAENTAEGFTSERSRYYALKADKYISQYPIDFDRFIGNEEATKTGDTLLYCKLSSGYNFATFEQFPLNSPDSLIFYGVYVQRTSHIGELLAKMENHGIVREHNFSFRIRAAKVFGRWTDPEPVKKEMVLFDGTRETVLESIEAMVVFQPKNVQQAEDIAVFLEEEAPKIEGGYEISDIRATATRQLIKALVTPDGFRVAKANIYRLPLGNVIALKQKSHISKEGWEALRSLVNSELYDYLISVGVEP